MLWNLDWIAKIFLLSKLNTNLVLEAHKNPLLKEPYITRNFIKDFCSVSNVPLFL